MKKVFPLLMLGVMLFTSMITTTSADGTASSNTSASTSTLQVETKIIEIKTVASSNDLQLFLGDGRIAVLIRPQEEIVKQIAQAQKAKSLVKFILKDVSFEVVSFEIVSFEEMAGISSEESASLTEDLFDYLNDKSSNGQLLATYGLETVISKSKMETIFKNQHELFLGPRRVFRRSPSQCFRRAHVWSYEMEADFNVAAGKYFLMYGDRCRTNWWFHVTPYVAMRDESGRIVDMAMDKEFIDYPKEVHEWSKDFIESRSRQRCEIIEYNQYNKYLRERGNACCHIIRTSRFYFYPDDMKTVSENPGSDITSWTNLSNAYSEYYPESGRRY